MSETEARKSYPVQIPYYDGHKEISAPIHLTAYEVYKFLFGEQKALIEDHCRGGFSTGELLALLYAKAFPQFEWRQRFDEALVDMRGV